MLGHSFILQDYDQKGKHKKYKGHTGAGSGNLWNFADAMQIDKTQKNKFDDELEFDETTAADEKAPFKLTIDERVELKFR